ncbi:MAG: IS1182 family transposase [Marinobacter sp.]
MGATFRPYSPDQELLLPPSLNEWLPEGHLAYFISDVVEELDLSAFYARYEGDGRRKSPFHPGMMLKVLIYAYATGVFSSRKIARKLEEDVAFRVLAAGNFPHHRTVCDFRKQHLTAFKAVFVQVVRIAQEAELIKLGTLAIDGTKVRANASKHKAMSYGRMREEEKRLSKEIDELCGQARKIDDSEDRQFGQDQRGDELPEELHYRQARLDKIRAAKAKLESEQRAKDQSRGRYPDDDRRSPRGGRNFKRDYGVPDDKDQSNFTDPQSRIMKTTDGFQQCYNGQLAVDGEFQLIVANRQGNNPSDNGCLIPLLEAVNDTLGSYPQQCLADAGYRNEGDLQDLEIKGIDGHVSLRREGKRTGDLDVSRYPATARMAQKLATATGRTIYAQRKHLVESVNGWIKNILGFRQFSLRGLNAVQGEWDLICLSLNLRRMSSLMRLE